MKIAKVIPVYKAEDPSRFVIIDHSLKNPHFQNFLNKLYTTDLLSLLKR